MLVYKYRGGSNRDIESLKNNQIFSASLESLNDIQEAKIKINDSEIEIFDLLVKSKAPKLENILKDHLNHFMEKAKKFGIYSLSKNYDNELLWAYYSNSHQGFCIEYDLEMLKQYQLNGEFFCDVEYKKSIPIINLDDILENDILTKKLLATKSFYWKHEEEFRIITGTIGVCHYYNRAVKSIYFGYRTDEQSVQMIMDLLKGRGIKYFKMYPKKDLYQLEKKEIEDVYKSYESYVENKFTPEYDENTSQYKDLIEKAISIVEQEPMCEEVLDAYVSSSKGTKENPVFYITYRDRIRGISALNYFISKDEIDEIWISK